MAFDIGRWVEFSGQIPRVVDFRRATAKNNLGDMIVFGVLGNWENLG